MEFSASLAHTLLSQSPCHAWAEALGETPSRESEAMDVGEAAHAYWLEGESAFVIVEAPDWRTKAAREARDQARAEGKVALLAHRWAAVQAMVAAGQAQVAQHDEPHLLVPELGIVEHSLYWTEDGVPCRATPDWLQVDHRLIVDLKTTAGSAHPAGFSRTLWDKGYAIQAAFYRRAVKQTYGVDAEWRWVVIETSPPYGLAVVSLDPEAEAFAHAQVTEALALWRRCQETHTWPGYPTRTAYAELPPWILTAWQQRGYYAAEEVAR